MAFKKELSEEEFSKLESNKKEFYTKTENGYILDIEGIEDTGALKRAKDREAQGRREAEKELKELRAKIEEIEGVDARKRGDIETLEKAWAKKLEDLEQNYKAQMAKREGALRNLLIDREAAAIAAEISTSPKLILPHIRTRLLADLDGETPATRVLDADGKISALSLDDLKKEFVANPDFGAIIIGSKASGSSAAGLQKLSQGSASKDSSIDLSQMSPKDLAARLADKSKG